VGACRLQFVILCRWRQEDISKRRHLYQTTRRRALEHLNIYQYHCALSQVVSAILWTLRSGFYTMPFQMGFVVDIMVLGVVLLRVGLLRFSHFRYRSSIAPQTLLVHSRFHRRLYNFVNCQLRWTVQLTAELPIPFYLRKYTRLSQRFIVFSWRGSGVVMCEKHLLSRKSVFD
jgi:hypothetical protein